MPEGNALLAPNVSSYSNPTVNQLLAAGGGGANAMDASTGNALQVANQAQQLQSGKITIDQQTYNLAKAKMDTLGQVYKSLYDDPTDSNASWHVGQLTKAGLLDPDMGSAALAQISSFGGDRQKIQQFALNGINLNQTHQEALEQAAGTTQLVNTGGQLQPVRVVQGAKGGVFGAEGSPIATTTTPGEKMGGITTKNPDGSSTFRPNSTLYDSQGNFLGAGGGGASGTPSIPVYRGTGGGAPAAAPGGGQEQGTPAPTAGGWQAGGTPPPRGSAPGLTPVAPADQGGTPTTATSAGAPSGAAPGAGAQSAMMTPNPQTMPVISKQMNDAATAALQNGQNTPANRNILRGYAVQNNLPYAQHMDGFEPQPAGVGAGISVPPQPTAAGQGGSPAGGGQGSPSAGMWTPGPQTMPVVTLEQAKAAAARAQTPQGTAADRNALRGYTVQNNIPLNGQAASTWEAQPGQAPQAAGQGGVPVLPAPAPVGGAVPPGRQPPAVQPVGAQPQGQQPATGQGSFGSRFGVQPAQGAGLTVGLSPGQEASLKAGSDGYAALSSDVSNPSGVNQRLFQLRTALGALRNTQTGLGTQQRQQLVGYLASLPGGLAKWAPGVDPDSASSYDIATKYLTAYSLNTPGAARSDAGLSTAQSANANTSSMMQKAAQDVTLSNIGLENGKRALINSFNASGADPGTFGKFASQWMQGADPRAFALPDMTPAERGQLYTGLQGPAKAAFLATVKKGMAANILTPNDLQGAAGNGQ